MLDWRILYVTLWRHELFITDRQSDENTLSDGQHLPDSHGTRSRLLRLRLWGCNGSDGYPLYGTLLPLLLSVSWCLSSYPAHVCQFVMSDTAIKFTCFLSCWGIVCLLAVFRGFRKVGPFVVMIYKMIRTDLLRFMIIYIIFVVGFSQGDTQCHVLTHVSHTCARATHKWSL